MFKRSFSLFFLLILLASQNLFSVVSDYPQTQFVANISASIPDWRPHCAYNADEAQILSALFEGLFYYDPFNLDPVPAIAESWTVSKDGLEWRFTLRSNASFENGDPITASVIRDSWIQLLDPNLMAPYASLLDSVQGVLEYRTGRNNDKSALGIIAADAQTLIVNLSVRAEHLPKILCHHAFSAVHPEDLKRVMTDLDRKENPPISSGAFKVSSINEDSILLEKNTAYWDAKSVLLPSVQLVISDDADALTAQFNRGEIQWLASSVTIARVLDGKAIHINPMFATEYFFFRTTWGSGAHKNIRLALLKAVPWAEIRSNYLIPAKTLVFPITGYPEITGISGGSLEEAKKILADAGYTETYEHEPLVITIPNADAFISLAEVLQKAWEPLGFTVIIRTTPYGDYYSSLRKNDYTVGITSWIGDFADPLSFLEMFRPESTLNDSGWINEAYEKLIIDASGITDAESRYAKLAEAESLLLNEGIILPIAHNPSFNIINTGEIGGWFTNALDIHPFKFIKFIPQKPLPGVAMTPKL